MIVLVITLYICVIIISIIKLFDLDEKLEWWWRYKRAKFINKAEDYENPKTENKEN